MKIVSWNCQGLCEGRVVELQLLIEESRPDVLCLQETWFRPGKSLNFSIPHFSLFRADRTDGRTRGGAAILVRDGLFVDSVWSVRSDTNEICAVRLRDSGGLLTIASVYCPPDIKLDVTAMEGLVKSRAVVSGDLNAHVDWCGSSDMNQAGVDLTAFLHRTGTSVLNNGEPTHWSHLGVGRTLDFIIPSVSLSPLCSSFAVLDCYGSDHAAVCFDLSLSTSPVYDDVAFPVVRRDWSKANWDTVVSQIDLGLAKVTVPCALEASEATIEQYDAAILTVLQNATALVPTCPSRELRSWRLAPATRRAIKSRHRFQRLFQRTKMVFHKLLWNRASRRVRGLIAADKGRALKRRVQSLERFRHVNMSKFWQVVKQVSSGSGCSSKRKMPPIASTVDGQLVCNDAGKAEVFADHLAASFAIDDRAPVNERATALQDQVSVFVKNEKCFAPLPVGDQRRAGGVAVTRSEFRWAVKRLRMKAPGLDEVPNLLLKRGGTQLHWHLRQLFNLSLAVGFVPSRWKLAVIVPLPREGKDLTTPGGYRPVSLLPTMAKLLEAILARKLYGVFEKAKLLPDHQSGFRSHRSTEDQLFRLAETVGRGLARRQVTVAAFLDFKGAFNSVWHDGLRFKLAKSPLATGLVRWLSSFLGDRQFCVRVGQAISDTRLVLAGVPQGSCLSPILFIFYTADMLRARGDGERPAVGSYADDVMIMASDKDPDSAARLVQLALRQAEWWSSAWKLPLQPAKCVVVVFSRRYVSPLVSLVLDGARLAVEEETKYLGVTFDRKLFFKSHFEVICKAAEKRLNGLRRLCGRDLGFSREAAVQVYKTMVRSVLEYGAPAWVSRFTCKKSSSCFQVLQNRCLRAALRAPPGTRISVLHQEAGILPFRERAVSRCKRFLHRAQRRVYGVRHLVKQQFLSPCRHPGPTAVLMPTERRGRRSRL